MLLSNEKKKEYAQRLLLSRLRLLLTHGFYGLLLMHVTFSLDETCETAATDGERIIFGPAFLDAISDDEIDFVLMHEIMHVALRHCFRGLDKDKEAFNIACDIVVNSNILHSCNMDKKAITLQAFGTSMHLAPNGNEGYLYTAEEVYEMLPSVKGSKGRQGRNAGEKGSGSGHGEDRSAKDGARGQKRSKNAWDDHSRWAAGKDELSEIWVKRFEDACEAISIRDPGNERGTLPLGAIRLFKELREPQIDWRVVLNDFVQEEIKDYSFSPPDRRFADTPFFLPDFNEKDDVVEDVLFMIDTSGSMSDDMITAAYSEVKGALDAFDGKLKGWLGFFDAQIIEPRPFENEDEFKTIRAAGGGGTDFNIIFEYVRRYMAEKLPASIVILTDGVAPFPEEKAALGIPVLWLINNDVITPPWGKIARIRL